MRLSSTPLLVENKQYIIENVKQAKKNYLDVGKISPDDFEVIVNMDPTKTRKFVLWMVGVYVNEGIDLDTLSSYIEEYNTFLTKGKTKTKDIYQFKSFNEFKAEVDKLNSTGSGVSNAELERDYETVIDNSDLLVIVPHTHEASRKVGLKYFAFRDCDEGKDSAWCTTYKAPNHFNNYYYNNNITFYYIRVKSVSMLKQIRNKFGKGWKKYCVLAIALLDGAEGIKFGKVDAYDGLDGRLTYDQIVEYTNIIGIS